MNSLFGMNFPALSQGVPHFIIIHSGNIRLCKKFVRRVKGVSVGIIILTRRTNFLHNLVYFLSTHKIFIV